MKSVLFLKKIAFYFHVIVKKCVYNNVFMFLDALNHPGVAFFAGASLGVAFTVLVFHVRSVENITQNPLNASKIIITTTTGKPQLPTKKYTTEVRRNLDSDEMDVENVKILCAVITTPNNLGDRAKAVNETWGKRCDKLLFMSTKGNETNYSLPVVELPVDEGRDFLWGKTKDAFRYIYEYYVEDYDWFLKADDDTYVVVENLRYLLKDYKSSELLYFGCRFGKFVENGFMSGGAGYVLSKTAVYAFIEEALDEKNDECKKDDEGSEDVEMGFCMQSVGAIAIDTRDSQGRGRFFPLVPQDHLVPDRISAENWFWDHVYYPSPVGKNCCSDAAISFHYITPDVMIAMDYLIYNLTLRKIRDTR